MVTSDIFKAYDVRGIYGEQIDGDVAESVGRAFARVIGDLSGKPVDQLRLGLGRDMRLTAPELAARYGDGMVSEGAHVLDAGMVGTEMLYFLVGSRLLDGGLRDVRRLVEAGLGEAAGGGSSEEVDVADELRERAMSFIDPGNVEPLKVVVD